MNLTQLSGGHCSPLRTREGLGVPGGAQGAAGQCPLGVPDPQSPGEVSHKKAHFCPKVCPPEHWWRPKQRAHPGAWSPRAVGSGAELFDTLFEQRELAMSQCCSPVTVCPQLDTSKAADTCSVGSKVCVSLQQPRLFYRCRLGLFGPNVHIPFQSLLLAWPAYP